MANFPLRCFICSKDHTYSDVSHLLTHISSKGHLATHFHISVRASQDPVLAQKLNEYNQWFNENDVGGYLADRMSKKDQKKSRVTTSRTTTTKSRGKHGRKAAAAAKKQSNNPPVTGEVEDVKQGSIIPVDPSIIIKQEAQIVETSSLSEKLFFPEKQRPAIWQHDSASIKHGFDGHQGCDFALTREQDVCRNSEECGTFFDFESPGQSLGDDREGPYHLISRPINTGKDNEDVEAIPEIKGNNAKLKGNVWPGMSLFDAASPDGKRMRNQRKNYEVSSVLERLSEQIRPREIIYTGETWTFIEDRLINGEVQSPPPPGFQSPKKRRKRVALTEKSTNKRIIRQLSSMTAHRFDKDEDEKPALEDALLLQQLRNNQPLPCPWTRSGNDMDAYQQHPGDVFREKPGPEYSYKLPNAYPYGSAYVYNQTENPERYLSGFSGKRRWDGYSHVPFHLSSGVELGPFEASISHRQEPRSKPFGNESTYNASRVRRETHPQSPTHKAHQHLTVPPLGTFGLPCSILNEEVPSNGQANPGIQTRSYSMRRNNIGDGHGIDSQRMTLSSFKNGPTISKAKGRLNDRCNAHGNLFGESSGDETIDQGIDSSPIRYVTRSAAQAKMGGLK